MSCNGINAQLACIWEATARKPGNVHRFADFADASYLDFLLSAAAIAPVLDAAQASPVGETILRAVQATRQVVRTNTNLGIILLLAPLAMAPEGEDLFQAVSRILHDLSLDDSKKAYQAIRLVAPAGLGQAEEQDIHGEPTLPLRAIMTLAADRDLVARQYTNDFSEVQKCGLPALLDGLERFGHLEDAIVLCHLTLLTSFPDSLIARKRGLAEAQEASRRAREVLQAGLAGRRNQPEAQAKGHPFARASGWCIPIFAEFDTWLRAEGNARNPGSTADLVTACLFSALRLGKIQLPLQMPWSGG
jgi:triphosphoribosyl-dephospho-CoA synthase